MVGVKLALGATPEECGRGDNLKSYVRNSKPGDEPGNEPAYVKVSLHIQNKCRTLVKSLDPDDHIDCNCRLVCEINLRNSERKLSYGDITITKREEIVKYLKETLKIDANNLFQILPQENTDKLLTNNGKDNLLNTEKAINCKLYELHNSLIDDSKKILGLVKKKEKISIDLHSIEMKLTKYADMNSISNKLKEVNDKISLMNKIKAWGKYTETKNAFKGELNLYNELTTTDIIESKIEGFKKQISQLEIQKSSYDPKVMSFNSLRKEMTRIYNYASDIGSRVRSYHSDLKSLQDRIERQEQNIASKELKLETYKAMTPTQDDEMKRKFERLSEEINNLTIEERKLTDLLNKVRSELKPLENQISDREENLKICRNGTDSIIPNDTKTCIDYIKKNPTEFKSAIFAPIFQYVGVDDNIYAQYLQSSVGFFTQCGILCTCDEDGIKVRDYIRHKNLSKVSVFTVTSSNSTKSLNINSLQGYDLGITSTLDMNLKFPRGAEPVKELLRRESGIQNILIGDKHFDMNKFSAFLKNDINKNNRNGNNNNNNNNNNLIDIRSLSSIIVFTSTLKIIFNRIRGKNISIQTEPFRLNLSFRLVEPGSLENREKLEKELQVFKVQFNDKNARCQDLESKIKSIIYEKDKLKSDYNLLANSIHSSRSKEISLNQIAKDIASEKKSLDRLRKDFESKSSQETIPSLYRNYATRLKEMYELVKKMEKAEIKELIILQIEKEISLMQSNIKAEEENLLKIQTVRKNHENKLRHTEKKMKEALEYAKSVLALKTDPIQLDNCPIKTDACCSFSLPEAYKEFDISYEELEKTLNLFQSEQRKLAKIRTKQNIENDSDKYTDLITKKAVFSEEMRRINDEIDQLTKKFDVNYPRWYKKIKKVVEEMNRHFCRYLDSNSNYPSKEAALGSITLDPIICDIPSNPSYNNNHNNNNNLNSEYSNVINKYELKICGKLKTFDDKRDLTGDDLSGGEKSFSTAMFLLSMRTLIEAPFCMMDEINQGMDESYEYDFYNLLMKGKQYVQYFVFSPTQNSRIPEILRDLRNRKYHNCLINMHVILCGKYMCEMNKENIISLEEVLSLKRKRLNDDLPENRKNDELFENPKRTRLY